MAELGVKDLGLRFGGLTVLEGLNFSVEFGELFALIGPNGAGKTSAFNCVSRIYKGEDAFSFAAATSRPVAARGSPARHRPHLPACGAVRAPERHGQHHDRPACAPVHQPAAADAVLPAVRREEVLHREAMKRIIELVELERVRHAHAGALPFGTQKIIGLTRTGA